MPWLIRTAPALGALGEAHVKRKWFDLDISFNHTLKQLRVLPFEA